jgi:hypothetical protein
MNHLIKNFIQVNLRGLRYVGLGYETSTRLVSLLIILLAGAMAVVIAGFIDNYIVDRKLVGILCVVIFLTFVLYFWLKRKFFFHQEQNIETLKENKSIVILVTFASYTIIWSIFYLVTIYFYGK